MSWRSVLRPLVRAIEWSRVHRVLVAPLLLLLWRSRSRPMHPVRIVPLAWGRGISIVIPERGGGEMLAFGPDGKVYALPFIGIEPKVATFVADSWSAFRSTFKSQ